MYLDTCLEMTTVPLMVKQEIDSIPADLENVLHSKVDIKEEFWDQDCTPQAPGEILEALLKQNGSKSPWQSTIPATLPKLLEPPPLIFFSEQKRNEILSSQHDEPPLPPVSFRPPNPPTLSEPPPLVFFSQPKRDAALPAHQLDSSQESHSLQPSATSQEPPQQPDPTPRQGCDEHHKMFYCLHCDFETTCEDTLYSHRVQMHPSIRFECDHCKKSFATNGKLRRHLTIHPLPNRTTLHSCSECDFSTDSRDTLRSHEVLKHRSPNLECDYCKKFFPLRSKLRQHMDMHIIDPQECTICDRWYKNRSTLDRHITNHHKKKPLSCDFPGCRKSYIQPISLQKHRVSHITNKLPRKKITTFSCTHCSAEFTKKANLTKHIRIHVQKIKKNSRRRVYQCDICKKILPKKVALRQHIRYEHLKNVRLYHCPYCDFTATHRSGVCLHKARKHRVNRFECDHCKKLFPIKQDLQVHITNNHNFVLQTCKICSRQFKSLTILRYHHTTNHSDRPFEDESQSRRRRPPRTNRKRKSPILKRNVKPLIPTRKSSRRKLKIPIVPAKMNPIVLLTRLTLPLNKNKEFEYINLQNSAPPPPGDFEFYSAFIKEEIQQEDPMKISAEFDDLDALPPSPGDFDFFASAGEEKCHQEDPINISAELTDLQAALQMAVDSFTMNQDTEVPVNSVTGKQEDSEVPLIFVAVKQEIETPATSLKIKQEPLEITPTSTALEPEDYWNSSAEQENLYPPNVKIKEEFWVDDYTPEPIGNKLEESPEESSQTASQKHCLLPQKCSCCRHHEDRLLSCQCNHKPSSLETDRSQFVTCEFCNRILISREVLNQHIREKHVKYCEQLRCKYCDFETLNKFSLCSHTLRKHSNYKFKCDYCQKRFPLKINLNRHIEEHHFSDKNEILFCSKCTFITPRPDALHSHMVLQHGNHRFQCDYCEQKFSMKFSLRKHMKIHIGSKTPTKQNGRRKNCRSLSVTNAK